MRLRRIARPVGDGVRVLLVELGGPPILLVVVEQLGGDAQRLPPVLAARDLGSVATLR